VDLQILYPGRFGLDCFHFREQSRPLAPGLCMSRPPLGASLHPQFLINRGL